MSFFSSDVYEATFAVPLCSRFRRFLDEGEHAELSGAMVELPTADEPLTVFFDGEPLEMRFEYQDRGGGTEQLVCVVEDTGEATLHLGSLETLGLPLDEFMRSARRPLSPDRATS